MIEDSNQQGGYFNGIFIPENCLEDFAERLTDAMLNQLD